MMDEGSGVAARLVELHARRKRKRLLKTQRVIKQSGMDDADDDDDMIPLEKVKRVSAAAESKGRVAVRENPFHKKGNRKGNLNDRAVGEAKKIQKAKQQKTMIKKSTSHVPDRIKEKRAKEFDNNLTQLKASIKDSSLSSKHLLLDWLRCMRNAYESGSLPTAHEAALTSLREEEGLGGFSWLEATFREQRFRKAMKVREGWTRGRLETNPWVLEQRQLQRRGGMLPPWAGAELDKLLGAVGAGAVAMEGV